LGFVWCAGPAGFMYSLGMYDVWVLDGLFAYWVSFTKLVKCRWFDPYICSFFKWLTEHGSNFMFYCIVCVCVNVLFLKYYMSYDMFLYLLNNGFIDDFLCNLIM